MIDAEDLSLTEAIWAVARELRHRSADSYAPFDLTPGQARALGVLARHGEMRMSALSEHLRIAPRSGTEVADDLEERGLVRRRPDPADRRAVLVATTPQGKLLAAQVRRARAAEGDVYLERLDERDRAELTRILRRLLDT